MKVKEESEKVSLKLSIQKTKIMTSFPIISWQIDGETVTDFIFLGSKKAAHVGSAACGIFLDQGSNPCILHWQADSLPLSHQGRLDMPSFDLCIQCSLSESQGETEGEMDPSVKNWGK